MNSARGAGQKKKKKEGKMLNVDAGHGIQTGTLRLISHSPISLVLSSKYRIYPQIHTLPFHESPLFSITSAPVIVLLPCLAVHLYR